jgi:predicted DNA-binding protein
MSLASKGDEQYMLRLPRGMRERLKQLAAANGRSINSEIIDAIESHVKNGNRLTRIEKRLKLLETMLHHVPKGLT